MGLRNLKVGVAEKGMESEGGRLGHFLRSLC